MNIFDSINTRKTNCFLLENIVLVEVGGEAKQHGNLSLL